MIAPCKDCATRSVGCHSVCAKYIDYSKACKDANKAMHEDLIVGFVHGENMAAYMKRIGRYRKR